MILLYVILGAFVALQIAWSIGRISELRRANLEFQETVRLLEVEKTAFSTHCNELRTAVAQLAARQPIAFFTDEQINKIVKTIFEMANPPIDRVN